MWSSFVPQVLLAEVPVDPSAAEAREWALEELSREVYNPKPSIFTDIGRWISELFANLVWGKTLGGNPLLAVAIAILLIAGVIFFALNASRVTRVRHVRAQSRASHTLFDDARSAAELRRDAEAALRSGDLNAAFLDIYRAMIRSLDERVLLEDSPGLTAREAAGKATQVFPDHESGWFWAASVFDDVRYGHTTVRLADVENIQAFDRQIAATRPRVEAHA